jgi:hypothetical protein
MSNLMICTPHPFIWGNQIENNEMDGACSTIAGRSGAYRGLVGKSESKRQLGKPRPIFEGNMKMDVGTGGGHL